MTVTLTLDSSVILVIQSSCQIIGKHYAEYEHPRSKMETDFAFLAVDWFEVYDCDLDLRFQRHTSYSIIVPNTNTLGQKLKRSSSYEPKDCIM